jgi:hypothetical protein
MSVVYPNESWPGDTEVVSLDGTTDVSTGLPYIAKGTSPSSVPSYEIQYNRRLSRQNSILALLRQGMVVDEGGLKIGVYPITFLSQGSWQTFEGATGVSVPDDDSVQVYLDTAGVLQTAALWPADNTTFLPLASVDAAGGELTITDRRGALLYAVPEVEAESIVDHMWLTSYALSIGSSQTDLEVYKFNLPQDVILEQLQVYCTGAATTVTVDVKESGTSVLSAPATPVANTVVTPGISSRNLTSGNALTVNVTTSSTGTLYGLHVTFMLKNELS